MAQSNSQRNDLVLLGAQNGVVIVSPDTPLTGLNYFDGKFLRAADLDAEQRYLRRLVEISNQAGGAGVVHGLDVSLEGQDTLKLGAGLAIDAAGRLLLLPQPAGLSIKELIEKSTSAASSAAAPAGKAGSGDFGDCVVTSGDQPAQVIRGNAYYLIVLSHAEALCGEEDVYGKLCEDACVTKKDRPNRLEGVLVRAVPLELQTALAKSQTEPLDQDHLRNLVASAYFEDERDRIDSLLSRAGLQSGSWCAGAPAAGGTGVAVALLARAGATTLFLDDWTARRERLVVPAAGYWQWRMAMRPRNVFLAQVFQFQCQLQSLLRAAKSLTENRALIHGGIVELPSAGYLPVTPGSTTSVNQQVRRLLGDGVDLRYCAVRHDAVAHAFDEAQHLERISLIDGLDNPQSKPEVDIYVPDGQIIEQKRPVEGRFFDATLTWGQEGGEKPVAPASISGRVLDPSGAVVAGAQLTLTNTGTNAKSVATTTETGAYTFSNLAPGEYSLFISALRFRPQTYQSIILASGERRALDVPLTVGSAAEPIVTKAGATGTIYTTPLPSPLPSPDPGASYRGAARVSAPAGGGWGLYFAGLGPSSGSASGSWNMYDTSFSARAAVRGFGSDAPAASGGRAACWLVARTERDLSKLKSGESAPAEFRLMTVTARVAFDIQALGNIVVRTASAAGSGWEIVGTFSGMLSTTIVAAGKTVENARRFSMPLHIKLSPTGTGRQPELTVELRVGDLAQGQYLLRTTATWKGSPLEVAAECEVAPLGGEGGYNYIAMTDYTMKRAAFSGAREAAPAVTLATGRMLEDQNVLRPGNEVHEASFLALESLEKGLNDDSFAETAARLLFPPAPPDAEDLIVRATREWVMFRRRTTKTCGKPTEIPSRHYQLYHVRLASLDQIKSLRQGLIEVDAMLKLFQFDKVESVEFEPDQAVPADRGEILQEWLVHQPASRLVYEAIASQGPALADDINLVNRRLRAVEQTVAPVSTPALEHLPELLPAVPKSLSIRGSDGIMVLATFEPAPKPVPVPYGYAYRYYGYYGSSVPAGIRNF